MGYRIVPLKKLADLGVFGANNLALNLESEPVGSLESQEIRSPQRDLPKHHFFSLSLSLSGTLSLNTLRLFLYLSLLLCYVMLSPILNQFTILFYSFALFSFLPSNINIFELTDVFLGSSLLFKLMYIYIITSPIHKSS